MVGVPRFWKYFGENIMESVIGYHVYDGTYSGNVPSFDRITHNEWEVDFALVLMSAAAASSALQRLELLFDDDMVWGGGELFFVRLAVWLGQQHVHNVCSYVCQKRVIMFLHPFLLFSFIVSESRYIGIVNKKRDFFYLKTEI